MNDNNQQTTITDNETTGQRAHEVIMMLTEEFERITGNGEIVVNLDTSHLFRAVFGWWAWINRSGKLVALAHTKQLGHESSPNVRSIIQHTLVLQWLTDDGEDALDAIIEYGEKNQRKLIADLKRAGWSIEPGIEPDIPEAPTAPHRLLGMIENFADLCIAYDARKLYVAYRVLSAEIHPSPQGAMAYVDDIGTLSNQATMETWGLLIQTAMCLLQAARTINPLLKDQPLSELIARAEAHFGAEIGLWVRTQRTS